MSVASVASEPYDRLTALDTSFLHLERLETPMHVGAVSVFEGAPFFDADGRFRIHEVRDLVASRLHLIPRFRKRLQHVPFDQGRPIWVDDERFDITYHVRLTALPRPGTWEQLMTLTNRVQEQLLDRSRPLWELWFVEGLEGGEVALIQKTHHALVDGVSGVDVATVLLDFSPTTTWLEPPPWQPAPAPSPSQLLVDSLRERITEPAELVRSVRSALRGPRAAIRQALDVGRALATLVTPETVAPRTSLQQELSRHRRLSVVRVPLADAKTIKDELGGTVNDVVLAAVASGFRELLDARGELRDDLHLRVMVPVSVRADAEHGTLGNRVSAMFVSLPVGEPDPLTRLDVVRHATRDVKDRKQALGAEFISGMSQYAAPTLLGLAARLVHRQRLINVVVTNVPGPQVPLYCMGARMLEAFPVVPLAHTLTTVVGILSYDGTLHFGLFADRDAVPDLDVLAAGIENGFVELRKVVESGALHA